MLYYIDTYTNRIWDKVTRSPVLYFRFYRGSVPSIDFQFVTDGETAALADGSATGTLGFKSAPTDAGYLIAAVSWTKSGSGATTKYTFTPTFLSTALDTALGSADSIPVYGEIKWVDGSNTNEIGFNARIYSNVNRGGETVPVTPSAFLSVAPNAAGSTDVSAAGGIAPVSVIASAGSGTYTYKLVLLTTGAPTGALVDMYIQVPASANPTIEVRNASSSGTVLHTVSGDPDNATYQHETFRFNGTAWVKFS